MARAAGPAAENYRETIVGSGTSAPTTEVVLRRGDDSRTISTQGPIHSEYGTYHGEDWHQNENGLTVAEAPDPPEENDESVSTKVRRVSRPSDLYVIESLNAKGEGDRTFIDPTTYLKTRREEVSARGSIVTEYREYQTFGNQQLPVHWSVKDDIHRTATEFRRTQYETGKVADRELAQPETQRLLVEFPPGVAQVDLPAKAEKNRFYVRVTIGGRGLDFLLDTGSGGIAIDRGVAKSLGLALLNETSMITAGRHSIAQAIVPNMTIGPLSMHNIVVDVVPEDSEETADAKVVGLLGFDFLAQIALHLDYDHGRLSASPASSFTPPQGADVVPLDIRIGTQQPMANVKVNDVAADRFVLDTGGAGPFLLFDYFLRRNPNALPGGSCSGTAELVGIGGSFESEVCSMKHFLFGRTDFTELPGYRVTSAQSFDSQEDGLIGPDLLSLYTLDIDYTNARIYLTPSARGRAIGVR